ncbi:hypothetical protein SAMD00023353_13200080 [Rosellinia necatrix]|uniref:Uncharacterized protein n=1 Tax=Rosellinia necatrix TaxID=77044 RepID=A0A1S8ABV4_ROSNE|nr:hypothetical protein SAMD00023353_13200080 [Rosellinia necatrix]
MSVELDDAGLDTLWLRARLGFDMLSVHLLAAVHTVGVRDYDVPVVDLRHEASASYTEAIRRLGLLDFRYPNGRWIPGPSRASLSAGSSRRGWTKSHGRAWQTMRSLVLS